MLNGNATRDCTHFCDQSLKDTHCSFCTCSKCSFCSLRASAERLGTLCSSHQAADVKTAMCQEWCTLPKHCAFCKCSACKMCNDAAKHPPSVKQFAPPPLLWPAPSPPPALYLDESDTGLDSTTNDCQPRCYAHKCNPSKGTDCDACHCRACMQCLVLREMQPSKANDPISLSDCSWMSSLVNLRAGQGTWCAEMSGTDRLACERYLITTGASIQAALGGVTSWQRCIWHAPTAACVSGAVFTCAAPAPFLPPSAPPPPPSAAASFTCTPANAHDSSSPQCMPWCSPYASRLHCTFCACKACGQLNCRQSASASAANYIAQPPPMVAITRCTVLLAGLISARHKQTPQWCSHFNVSTPTVEPSPLWAPPHSLHSVAVRMFTAELLHERSASRMSVHTGVRWHSCACRTIAPHAKSIMCTWRRRAQRRTSDSYACLRQIPCALDKGCANQVQHRCSAGTIDKRVPVRLQ